MSEQIQTTPEALQSPDLIDLRQHQQILDGLTTAVRNIRQSPEANIAPEALVYGPGREQEAEAATALLSGALTMHLASPDTPVRTNMHIHAVGVGPSKDRLFTHVLLSSDADPAAISDTWRQVRQRGDWILQTLGGGAPKFS